jgi:hypothetical protein
MSKKVPDLDIPEHEIIVVGAGNAATSASRSS